MHFHRIAFLGIVSAGLSSTQARACEFDPFLFQLPGETEAQAQQRSDQISADYSVKRRLDRETYDNEKSSRIYLARVVSATRGSFASGILPSTNVHPLISLKGTLPSNARTLTDEAQSGTCTDYGDGRGAWEQVGTLVVVFEGLPKTRERPRGIDSLPAMSIRTVSLLDKLREFGKDLEQ